jgi:hypothetical protein
MPTASKFLHLGFSLGFVSSLSRLTLGPLGDLVELLDDLRHLSKLFQLTCDLANVEGPHH